MIRTRVSRMFLLLFASLMCWGLAFGATPSEAQYGRIDQLTGSSTLSGGSLTYNVTMTVSQTATLTLTAHMVGTGSGTKISWSAQKVDQATPGDVTVNDGAPVTTIDSNGRSVCPIKFTGVSASTKFTITAKLVKQDGGDVDGVGTAGVTVSFTNPVALTGVTLDKNSFTARVRAKDQYLTAIPTPSDATIHSYSWSTSDPQIVAVTQPSVSQDMAVLSFVNTGSARIMVTATGHDSTSFTTSCDVTVIGRGELAEDEMGIDATVGGSSDPTTLQDIQALRLYGSDEDFIKAKYNNLTSADIVATSLMPAGSMVRYLVGDEKITAQTDLRVPRARIANTLGKTDYETAVAAAMTLDVSPVAANDMVPMLLQFDLNGTYPDNRTPLKPQSSFSAQDFHNHYQLMKYFERNNTRYAINLFDLMGSDCVFYNTKTDRFELSPLVVFVNGPAPNDGRVTRRGDQNPQQFGAYYDSAKKVLFIYDGDGSDGTITDPILLEKRPSSNGGGGGGGGCSAGAGVFALIALAGVAVVRKFRA